MTVGFILSISASALMAFAAVWFALRETARAEVAMEMEYERSEQLLANILPASIAARLKDPDHATIADRYDDASILFADIAGFTERASETAPCDLVAFLDGLPVVEHLFLAALHQSLHWRQRPKIISLTARNAHGQIVGYWRRLVR